MPVLSSTVYPLEPQLAKGPWTGACNNRGKKSEHRLVIAPA
jgi:hypothetical protein